MLLKYPISISIRLMVAAPLPIPNFLVVDGIPQILPNPVFPVTTLLSSTPGAAYTTTRTAAFSLFFWDRHLIRLSRSVELLQLSGHIAKCDDLISKVNGSVNRAMDLAVKCYNDDVEMAVTVIVGGKGVEEFSVLVHLGVYVPTDFGSVGATLALAGKGRGEMAEAKCSDWVRQRKEMEKLRPPGTTELLLSDDGDQILEGSITNFFVVCQKEDGSCEVQTAPVNAKVLPGIIRQVVIEACMSLGIPCQEVSPSWCERELWREAFITSSLRLVQHVEKIQVPTSLQNLHLKNWNELSWTEKQFQGPGVITAMIQFLSSGPALERVGGSSVAQRCLLNPIQSICHPTNLSVKMPYCRGKFFQGQKQRASL